MRNLFLISIVLFTGCAEQTVVKQHEDCSNEVIDRLNPPDGNNIGEWFSWALGLGQTAEDTPAELWHCWFQPKWQVPSSEPSSEPVIVDREELPPDAKEATWLDDEMPGYIIYYTVKSDGSGYNYFAVKNDPKELANDG